MNLYTGGQPRGIDFDYRYHFLDYNIQISLSPHYTHHVHILLILYALAGDMICFGQMMQTTGFGELS